MKIKVLYKPVGKPAEVREIRDDYEVLQEMCGGCFSASPVRSFIPLPELRNVWVCYHDMGKIIGLPFNCHIGAEPLVGNIVFYSVDVHGEGMDMNGIEIALLSFLCECEPIDSKVRFKVVHS